MEDTTENTDEHSTRIVEIKLKLHSHVVHKYDEVMILENKNHNRD